MTWVQLRRISEIILPYACVLFLFAAAFGMMHIGVSEHMHQCPFMGMVTVCDMTALQHLASWQQMYSAILLQSTFAALLYATLVFLALHALFRIKSIQVSPDRFGARSTPTIFPAFSNPIMEALSNGILHPKVF